MVAALQVGDREGGVIRLEGRGGLSTPSAVVEVGSCEQLAQKPLEEEELLVGGRRGGPVPVGGGALIRS